MVEQEAPLRTLIITNFSFIGSAKVGWYLRSKLAAGTRCAMEHRGVAPVAPVVMTADADIESAIPSLAKGGFTMRAKSVYQYKDSLYISR